LVIRTNNLHNEEDTIPLSNVDWFHYGGIIRSVEIHEFDKAAVESVKLIYHLEGSTAHLTAEVDLEAFTAIAAPLTLSLDGQVLASQEITLNGKGQFTLNADLENIKLWSPESPNLYTFTVEFAGDTLRERTGFRTIEIRDSKFLLNGQPLYFKGVNRHEEHPEWGFAVPLKLVKKDIDIIRDMGCNVIRGSHYPNAKATLDYMDETGMLSWEEIPMWGFKENHLANETVRERGIYLHTQMVKRDYNHPAIVVWGLNNEVDTSTQAAWEVAKLFREAIEKQDKTRLITYASNRGHIDICYEFADFIAVNNYTAWYSKDGSDLQDWNTYIDKLIQYMEQTGNGNKPIVISEFGAGAIYGVREMEEGLYWTENYQKEYLEYTLDLFMDHPRIQGAIIWQYCDIRSGTRSRESGIKRLLSRPRSFNNKGLVNEFRRPKMAYYSVKERFCRK
jgi:beta-glucuronidase